MTGPATGAAAPPPEQRQEHHEDSRRRRRLFRNAGIYAIGLGSSQLLVVLLAPLYTTLLAPQEFGVWTMGMMLVTGLASIFNPALHGAIGRFYYDHEHDQVARRRFQGTLATFLYAWPLALSALLLLAGPWFFEATFSDLPFLPFGLLVIAMALLGNLRVLPEATWVAAERSGTFVAFALLSTLVDLVGALLLIIVLDLGVLGLFYARLASLILIGIPYAAWTARHVGFAWDPKLLRGALAFSLPLVPHLLAHWLLSMSDRWLLESMVGLEAVGIYGAAYLFVEAVNLVAMAMNRSWVPIFTRAFGDPTQHAFIAKTITWFLLVLTSLAVSLAVLSPTLVRAFFDVRYQAAAPIGPILAAGGFFLGLYYVYVAGLFYAKKNGIIPFITVTAGLLNVGLNIVLIPEYGVTAAAATTLASYVVLCVGIRWGCRRVVRLPFELARVRRLALVGCVALAAGLAVEVFDLSTALELTVKLAILGLAALALSLLGLLRRPAPSST